MVYSSIVPYVPFVAMMFFFFKYYVDKYNLSFVYNTEFRGVGIIKRRVVPFSIFNIVVFQLLNVGFFAAKVSAYGKTFLIVGVVVILIELISIIGVTVYTNHLKYNNHIKKRER